MNELSMVYVGYIAATLTTVAFIPQVLQTLKTRHTKDLSLGMYIILTIGFVLWTVYGFILDAPPIYISNIILIFLGATMLYLKIKHG